jgi:hypothetical protein
LAITQPVVGYPYISNSDANPFMSSNTASSAGFDLLREIGLLLSEQLIPACCCYPSRFQ